MIKKKSLLKISLVLFVVFTIVGLCLCSVLSSSNMAEAKSNSSNNNSVKFKCAGDDYLCVFSEVLEIEEWVKGEYDCFKAIDDYLQAQAPGATWECNPSESYYGKTGLGVTTEFATMVLIKGSATYQGHTATLYAPFYIGVSKEYGDDPYDYLSYINGSLVDLPILTGASTDTPMYFQPGASYYFTNYSFSSSISISGNVIDDNNKPVDGAKVSLTPENANNAVVPEPVITVNGAFTFSDVDPSILPATLNAEKEGYTFTPVRITENDIVDGKIVLSNLVLNKSTEKPTEIAQTMDINYYFVIALMGIALCGIIVAMASRSKAKNI